MTPTWGLLDYPDAAIKMTVSTDMERNVRLFSCAKEPETIGWLEQIPAGDVLYDIGANVGAYTLVAAARGVQVVAFEPDPFNVCQLHRNLALNGFRATVLPFAVGTPRLDTISNTQEPGRTHTLGRVLTYDPMTVPVLDFSSIMRLGLPHPQWVKLDVDGSEGDVLACAQGYLYGTKGILVEVMDSTEHRVGELLVDKFRLAAAHRHGRSNVVNQIWVRHDP